MFGADTSLVMDALGMTAVISGIAAGAVYWVMRKRKPSAPEAKPDKSKLEKRVEVLERIATDRSIDLAEEIEALRGPKTKEPTA